MTRVSNAHAKVEFNFGEKKNQLIAKNPLAEKFDCIYNLDEEHLAVRYCKDRKIPQSRWKELYYTKEKLLDNGDRWENILAANIKSDNPYR